jgi:hypothetical protein
VQDAESSEHSDDEQLAVAPTGLFGDSQSRPIALSEDEEYDEEEMERAIVAAEAAAKAAKAHDELAEAEATEAEASHAQALRQKEAQDRVEAQDQE